MPNYDVSDYLVLQLENPSLKAHSESHVEDLILAAKMYALDMLQSIGNREEGNRQEAISRFQWTEVTKPYDMHIELVECEGCGCTCHLKE